MNERISNICQVGSIRRYVMVDGQENGIDVIDCDNGKIRFLLNVSKGCDIMQLYHEGMNVSFVSKNGFSKNEAPFLRRFEGGMLYTCGLDSVGGREGYEIHGTYHNTPARITKCELDENIITVEAVIRDTALFGKNLVMKRRITSELGSGSVKLKDTLSNEGYKSEEYSILYHVNLGYPMLDDRAKIIADINEATPRTPWSEKNKATMFSIDPPVRNMEECCYFLDMNSPKASLCNEKIGKRFTLSYSKETLPCFIEWKSMASGDYALGLEPSTTELDGRFKYSHIDAGSSVDFKLELSVEKTD